MDEREWLTERFERNRAHLRVVAYRMLGSVSEADDAVQEAWLRIRDQDPQSIENMQAWLTTVVGRGRRLAFVLHDIFGVPFADIASAIERSEGSAQQLASRARRRLRGSSVPDRDLAQQKRVVDAFFSASRDSDFEALLKLLDPDVELRIDGGALRSETSRLVRGADAVAAQTATYSKLYPFVIPALVNGAAGAVVAPRGRLFSVMAFTVTDAKIVQIDALLDPERLQRLGLTIPLGADNAG